MAWDWFVPEAGRPVVMFQFPYTDQETVPILMPLCAMFMTVATSNRRKILLQLEDFMATAYISNYNTRRSNWQKNAHTLPWGWL